MFLNVLQTGKEGHMLVTHTHTHTPAGAFFFPPGLFKRSVCEESQGSRRSLASYLVHLTLRPPHRREFPPPPRWPCICSSRNFLLWTRAMLSSDSSESHFCNRAQPSAALLLQLSLFLRHSSEAISLTRPAHFFFPLLPSPTPLLFFTITLHYTMTFFFSLLRYLAFAVQLFNLKGSFLRCTLFLLFPVSFSLALFKSAFITPRSAALFCEALLLSVFRVRGQFPVAILGLVLPVCSCFIQIPGCWFALTPPSSQLSVSLPFSRSVSPPPLPHSCVIFNECI